MALARLLAFALAGAAAAAAPAARPRPRGLILVSVDTLRADRLGCYGAAEPTPALDAFAAGAVLFEKAYSAATWTTPSHATILTGVYPSSHGAGGSPPVDDRRGFSPDVPTLAELLRARGFKTAGFYFGPTMTPRWGFARGFDSYQSGDLTGVPGRPQQETTLRQAADWLAANAGSGRFFLFVHTFLMHRYGFLQPPAPGAPRCPPVYDFTRLFGRVSSPADPLCKVARQRYDAAAACMDDELGRFLGRLDALGLSTGTVVAFTSDHGESLCEPHARARMIGHGWPPYEQLERVPLIVRLPGGPAGTRVATPVGSVDIAPTLLDALGVPAPAGFQGRSLLPLARAGSGPARTLFSESDTWQMALEGRFKYVRYDDGFEELYDVSSDPGERVNLAGSRAAAAKLSRLRARLRAFVAGQRLGYRLVVRGRKGDRFEVRLESRRPFGYAVPMLVEAGDRLKISADRRVLTASLTIERDGDEDWLAFEPSVPFAGTTGTRPPPPTAPAPLRALIRLNGRPLARSRLLVGARRAAADGLVELDASGSGALVDAAPRLGPGVSAALWRRRDSPRPDAGRTDEKLREALRAEGYLP